MRSYPTANRASNGTPTPDALDRSGGTVAVLRARLDAEERSAAIARSERTQAIADRDAAREELAAVRRELAGAVDDITGATALDYARALVCELAHARDFAARAIAARRVLERVVKRLSMTPPATPHQ